MGLLASVELARRGHRVFAGIRNPGAGPAVAAACRQAGVSLDCVVLDVTRPETIARAVREVEAKAGHIDVLVNNAGLAKLGFFEEVSPAEFALVLDTNFHGAVAMTRAVLPGMRVRRAGHIVNISSVYGFMGNAMNTAYCSSKWALEGFSESLRVEMKPFGVTVSVIEPGSFATEILDESRYTSAKLGDPASPYHAAAVGVSAAYRDRVRARAGDPQVVARVIADVAERENPALRYVVGKDARRLRLLRSLLPAFAFEAIFVRAVARAMRTPPSR